MDSLLFFPVGRFILYNMPVYPGALRVADHTRSGPETTWRLPDFPVRRHDLNLSQNNLKSATIQAAPVIRKVRPNSDQFRCLSG